MKQTALYLLTIFFLTSCATVGFPKKTQAQNRLIEKTRNDGSVISNDYRLFSQWNFKMPRAADTSNRVGLFNVDSLGMMLFDSTHQRVWIRSTSVGAGHKWVSLANMTDVTNNSFW